MALTVKELLELKPYLICDKIEKPATFSNESIVITEDIHEELQGGYFPDDLIIPEEKLLQISILQESDRGFLVHGMEGGGCGFARSSNIWVAKDRITFR